MRPYTNPAYAVNRLANTIVRGPDGQPFKVVNIGEKRVVGTRLIDGVAVDIAYNEMDINPVPLGYCNSRSRAMYLARIPKRQDWKQGLRHENCRVVPDLVEAVDHGNPVLVDFPKWDKVAMTITNQYPSIVDCIKAVSTRKIASWAFHRYFSVDMDFFLHYKGAAVVGKIDPKNPRKYELADSFWWVKEALEESLA